MSFDWPRSTAAERVHWMCDRITSFDSTVCTKGTSEAGKTDTKHWDLQLPHSDHYIADHREKNSLYAALYTVSFVLEGSLNHVSLTRTQYHVDSTRRINLQSRTSLKGDIAGMDYESRGI
jgi:hypothetical protein